MIEDDEFARRIRAARAYLGLTLEEAGARLDLSSHQLSRRERADVKPMRIPTAERFHIATVYSGLANWPTEFFTSETMPPLAPPGELEDPLDPVEVVRSVAPPSGAREKRGRR